MNRATHLSLICILLAGWLAEVADARRSSRRLTSLVRPGWCALISENANTPQREVFVFEADGPSATITFLSHNEGLRIDNVYVIEEDLFDLFARPHLDSLRECGVPEDVIYDFDAPGAEEVYLEIFDVEPTGWRYELAAWTDQPALDDAPASAPRRPFDDPPSDDRGGAIELALGGWAGTTIEGLEAGKRYVVGAWWFGLGPDTPGFSVTVPGVDTIDVSAVDTSLIGHFYHGDNRSILFDLFHLLRDRQPPQQRAGLTARKRGETTYREFRP